MIKYFPAWALAVVAVAAGCQAHTEQPKLRTSVVTVVSTDTPGPGDSDVRRDLLQRFTSDIWPAVVAYNGEGPSQGGPGNKAWAAITDPSLGKDAWNSLRDAVHHLGVVSDGDSTHGPVVASDTLRAVDTRVTELSLPNATVQVCYAYSAVSYPTDAAHPQYSPAASEAEFRLRMTDKWYLDAISNDHAVPGCGTSKS